MNERYIVVYKDGTVFCGLDEETGQYQPNPVFKDENHKDVVVYARKDVAQEVAKHYRDCKVKQI